MSASEEHSPEQRIAELEHEVAKRDAYIAAYKEQLDAQMQQTVEYSASLRYFQSQQEEQEEK